jgi:hypothetical protein
MAGVATKTGFAALASLAGGIAGTDAFTYIAVGVGTTAANSDNTTLESEITDSGLARAADAAPTRATTTVTNDTLVLEVTFNVTTAKNVTELAVLNAASTGTMLWRDVFTVIGLTAGSTFLPYAKTKFAAAA